ncbi:MAG TPA: DNA-formamidopyrimidine glycosylase family protein [Vicinamibacterales bacterium]
MPEGDTIFLAARAMHRFLAGHVVTRFESVYPSLTRVAEDRPIIGRIIESVAARGKHLLVAFSGDLTLRTHQQMNGSWHLYRHDARWRMPVSDMRVIIGTSDVIAVAFRIQIAEFLSGRELARHRQLGALGPDLLHADFNASEVIRRMHANDSVAIADVLLNQRVLAGIGNEFKSEILFVAGVQPFTPVIELSDADLQRILDVARTQLADNVTPRSKALTTVRGRRTTRSMNPAARLWVYGRAGKACRRCGAPIQSRKTGIDARLTYWCPRCQR